MSDVRIRLVRWLVAAGCLALGASLPATARPGEAATKRSAPPTPQTRYFGEWRYLYSHVQRHPLNASGDTSGLGWYLDHRLDVGVQQQVRKNLTFGAELELFYGQVDGDFDRVGAAHRPDARETLRGWDLKTAEMRQVWVGWATPWFRLKVGQMGSHWGLGLLANDGRPQPGRFGWQDQGDLSDRVLVTTRPLAAVVPNSWLGELVVALGGGVVYRDENSSLRDGELAGEAILSAFYPGDALWSGLYVTGRFLHDDPGNRFDVLALDLFTRWTPAGGRSGPMVAAELAFVVGETDRAITAEHPDGLTVVAFGAVARVGWRFDLLGLAPELEVGYASGDPDPYDGTITSFSFDPDYKVGLVLFDSVLRAITAMAAQEAADPERVGQPVPGTDQLASGGRVTNAVYVYPTLRFEPIERLNAMVGLLWAFSAVEFAQSYQTFRNGGVPTNPYGLAGAGHELGVELDLGLDWDQPIGWQLHLKTGLQAGWFFPGNAFDRPDGSRPGIVARLMARAALVW